MTKKDTMAKLPGLFKREGVYQLRTMIPMDLQGVYQGRAKIVESLGITSADAAKTVGTAHRAMRLAEFEQKRRELNPQKLDKVTPELARMLAQRVTTKLLAVDEKVRADPAAAKLLLRTLRAAVPSKLTIGPAPLPTWLEAPVDPLEGLTGELAAELAGANAGMDAHAAMQMAMLMERMEAGDTLIVTKLDRIGRDSIDVQQTVSIFEKLGMRLIVLQLGNLDLTSSAGALMVNLAAVADFERELIIERTQAGQARARAEGKHMGRPAKTTEGDRTAIRKALLKGATVTSMAEQFKAARPSSASGNRRRPESFRGPGSRRTPSAGPVSLAKDPPCQRSTGLLVASQRSLPVSAWPRRGLQSSTTGSLDAAVAQAAPLPGMPPAAA